MKANGRVIQVSAATVLAAAATYASVWEGKENKPYLDTTGTPTVCYGYTTNVNPHKIYTDDECYHLLDKETRIAAEAVDRLVKVPMTPERKVAMIDFVYNAGQGNFAKSTMLRKLNAGDTVGACNELPKWVYSKGRKLGGLVKRRESEREWCLIEHTEPSNVEIASDNRVSGVSVWGWFRRLFG